MPDSLTFHLHRLTTRLDGEADRILQAELGLSYRRFLVLVVMREMGDSTQRALAEAVNVSDPAISRMAKALADDGMVTINQDPGGGNRKRLTLTAVGQDLVQRSLDLLEGRFAKVVAGSQVSYDAYLRDTQRLIAALDAAEEWTT